MKLVQLVTVTVFCLQSYSVSSYDLTLLHVNDIHVRMEETSKYSSTCKQKDKDAGKCYGGLARLRRAVQDIKKTRENVLWLNAGDFFQGTIWYTQFKWEVVSKFSNMLDFDAMTLGNHEFDDSIAGVVPFLKNQTCKVVVSNLNDSLVPAMKGLTVKSAKFQVGEKTVGVVGYLTPDTKFIADPEELIILDEIESLKPVVAQLHQEGVEIIVALGHSGYEKDQEIAASVPHLDVVVGAHTHSFLFSPSEDHPNPSNNQIRGPYPTIVNNPAGHKTIVLQAYAFTKYLGNVDLKFSSDGSLDSWSGSPILLDSTFLKDPEVEEELKPYKVKLDEISKVVIGSAAKTLLHSRDRESLMGNFVTDAMLRPWENKTMPDGSKIRKYQPNCHLTDISRLALANSGGIRTPFEKGNITQADLLAVFPFQNTFDLITIAGKYLRQAFENSISHMTRYGQDGEGRFLQVSGFRVIYDVRKPVGQRVVSLKVVCHSCQEGFVEVEDSKQYNVVTSNYVVGGGDHYTMITNNMITHLPLGSLDTDVMRVELEQHSPITADLQDRIVILADQKSSNGVGSLAVDISLIFLSLFSGNLI